MTSRHSDQIFHLSFFNFHFSLKHQAVNPMANEKCQMRYGKSPIFRTNLACLPLDRQECLSYQKKTHCLTLGHGSGSLKVPSCEFLLTPAFSPQPTRCLDANDGWHDGVRRGGCVCR
jgi:hypothetical protein